MFASIKKSAESVQALLSSGANSTMANNEVQFFLNATAVVPP